MKKIICLLLAILFLLPTVACGVDAPKTPGTTANAKQEAPANEALNKAMKALEAGNLEVAYRRFSELGEAGEEGIAQIHQLYKEELLSLYEANRKTKLKELVDTIVPDIVSEELYHSWIMALATEKIDAVTQQVKDPAKFNAMSSIDIHNEIREIDELLDAAQAWDKAENKDLLDIHYRNAALGLFLYAEDFYSDTEYLQAKELLEKCSEGSEGYAIQQGLDLLAEGKYSESLAVLQQYIPRNGILYRILITLRPETPISSMNNMLDYYRTIQSVDDDAKTYSTLDAYMSGMSTYTYGIDGRAYAPSISDEFRKQIKDLCGDAPAGKILILHRQKVYGSSKTTMDMDNDLMACLPPEYYPNSLEEVTYVILLDSTYAKKGKFQNGTVRILETTKLTLYSTATEKVLYTKSVKGALENTMFYTGTAPKYYSCGSPNMKTALLNALETIQTLQ